MQSIKILKYRSQAFKHRTLEEIEAEGPCRPLVVPPGTLSDEQMADLEKKQEMLSAEHEEKMSALGFRG